MKKCIACKVRFSGVDWKCPVCGEAPKFIDGYPVFQPYLPNSSGCFKVEYFSKLSLIEAKNFWFRSRNRLIILVLKRYFSSAYNFLEVGCGTGFVLSAIEDAFPKFSLCGSDIYTEGLKFAKQRLKRVTLFQMDFQNIPFDDEFDAIGAFDVLEHIKNDTLVLSQMYQALHKNGRIILTVPQHNFLWSKFDEAACHLRRYDVNELKTKVENAGFKIIKVTSFFSLLFPLMLTSRLRERWKTTKDYDVMQAIELSPLPNALLEKIVDFERILIRLGVSFPFGGSLLLIAHKT